MEISRNKKALSQQLRDAELQFESLIELDGLDHKVESCPSLVREFEQALEPSLESAYCKESMRDPSHLFLQRVLYRINRLKLFWYDDLDHYKNERSDYLRQIRDRIESRWSNWELSQVQRTENSGVASALRERANVDVRLTPSTQENYFRDHMGLPGYRKLLAIASLDGLVEASQLSRTLGGVANKIHSMMTRLLVEEYGGGRLSRKHSSFFKVMLEELGMNSESEAYFEEVPWEVLATINHSFLLSERKFYYLRYVGGLLYTEVSVPAAFDNYRIAAERLGISDRARGYWDLHIKEDERHGRWMLDDVALPLSEMYPSRGSEIVLGYDQQKFMSARAGIAIERAVRVADYNAGVRNRDDEALEVAA